jgi:hypothetical protein
MDLRSQPIPSMHGTVCEVVLAYMFYMCNLQMFVNKSHRMICDVCFETTAVQSNQPEEPMTKETFIIL